MKCTEIRECLFDHVLRELSPDVEIKVNEHLAICKECTREFNKAESVVSNLRRYTRYKPSPVVYDRIAGSLTAPRRARAKLLGIPKGFVFALGAFLFGVVLTKSLDTVTNSQHRPSTIDVRYEEPRRSPFSDTVEFYAAPARNLARI